MELILTTLGIGMGGAVISIIFGEILGSYRRK
jgi:hypothetical protein